METEGFPPINVGFGIKSSTDLCGIVGSGVQFEYSVIGGIKLLPLMLETPTAANKLMQLTKLYGLSILVDEETRQATKEQFHTREIDFVAVKNASKPITAFEIISRVENEISHDTMTVIII